MSTKSHISATLEALQAIEENTGRIADALETLATIFDEASDFVYGDPDKGRFIRTLPLQD